MTIRYELRADGHAKFWEVGRVGKTLTTRWGKIGADGQSKEKSFASENAAKKEEAALIAEKTAKGYARVFEGAGAKVFQAIVADFKALEADLEKVGFKVTTKYGKPASRASIEKAEKARGRAFPKSLITFLQVADGLSFESEVAGATIRHRLLSTAEHVKNGTLEGEVWFPEFDDEKSPRRSYVIADWPQVEVSYGFVTDGGSDSDPDIRQYMHGEDISPYAKNLQTYLRMALTSHRELLAQASTPEAPPPTKASTAEKREKREERERVVFTYGAQSGRGTRLGTVRIEQGNRRRGPDGGPVMVEVKVLKDGEKSDPDWTLTCAIVRLDRGVIAYIPEEMLTPIKRRDAYERFREDLFEGETSLALIADLARAVGPLSGGNSSPEIGAAAMLAPYPVETTLRAILRLYREGKMLKGFDKERTLEKTGDERIEDRKAWKDAKWQHSPRTTVGILLDGVEHIVRWHSVRAKKAPASIVPKATCDLLLPEAEENSTVARLLEFFRSKKIEPRGCWTCEVDIPKDIGLPLWEEGALHFDRDRTWHELGSLPRKP